MIFNHCKKEVGKNFGTLKFTEAELNIIPYKANDTIIFKDSIGDSLVYKSEGRFSEMYRYYRDPDNYGYKTASDYYDFERNTARFNNNGPKLVLEFDNPFITGRIVKYFKIICNFNNDYFSEWYEFEANNITPSIYHDTLKIINRKFYSVYELKENNASSTQLFYTFKEGIVGFKTNDGKYWYLK